MKRLEIIAALVIFLYSGMVHAQWYQVEIIVFESLNPLTDGELWNNEPGLPPLTSVVPLVTVKPLVTEPVNSAMPVVPGTAVLAKAPERLIPYAILPDSRYRLHNIHRRLRQSNNYRPIYHVSWLQPGQDGPRARAVQLQAEAGDSLVEMTMPPLLVTNPLPVEFYEPIQLMLDGTVRLRSSSFLYADLDMVLFKPPPVAQLSLPATAAADTDVPAVLQAKPLEYVRLRESRRIRLNDLQYFDHPLFGVVMQVSRYEPNN